MAEIEVCALPGYLLFSAPSAAFALPHAPAIKREAEEDWGTSR
jgi:hypothetical protein